VSAPRDGDRLYFRQFLAGRDFATGQHFAREMVNYVYAIGDRVTGEAVLVDAAYAPDELLALLESDGMTVGGALLTHYHQDHAGGWLGDNSIRGIAALLELVDIPIHAQRPELPWVTLVTDVPSTSITAHDPGDVLTVGAVPITLLGTPGHTPGSQCLLVGDRLLTGDTLFLSGCGRTDLPGGDVDELYESLFHRLAVLPDGTEVYAGHAYDPAPSAQLGALRVANPVLAPTDLASWRAHFS
jgi:glyoxylase-like metal-dependent hydrolase (beta-lactamase superfamily II)